MSGCTLDRFFISVPWVFGDVFPLLCCVSLVVAPTLVDDGGMEFIFRGATHTCSACLEKKRDTTKPSFFFGVFEAWLPLRGCLDGYAASFPRGIVSGKALLRPLSPLSSFVRTNQSVSLFCALTFFSSFFSPLAVRFDRVTIVRQRTDYKLPSCLFEFLCCTGCDTFLFGLAMFWLWVSALK